MHSFKRGVLVSMAIVLLCASRWAFASQAAGEWSGTIASAAGDDISLVGVPDHFRLAGSVTESLSGRTLTASDLAPGGSVTLRAGAREADGRFPASRVALQPKSPLTLSGQIDSVASDRRSIALQGVSVSVDGLTAFAGRSPSSRVRSVRDLAAGMTVRVTLMATPAGSLRADEVLGTSPSPDTNDDQELKGAVTAISDASWTIGSTVFVITDQTVFVGGPVLGDLVEVKFHTDATGASIADRIEKEDSAPDPEVEFSGVVEAIGSSSWTISGRVVVIDSATQIIGNPVMGDTVEVDALRATDGTLTAVRIKAEDVEPQEVEFKGTVESIGASSWTISGQTIGVDGTTQILGSPAVGDTVEVKALKDSAGALKATRIEKEDAPGSGDDGQGGGGSGGNSGDGSGSNRGPGGGGTSGGQGSGNGGSDGGNSGNRGSGRD